MLKKILPCLICSVPALLAAQQVNYLVTEFTHANYQDSATTFVPMSDVTGWNWQTYGFYAAMDTNDLVQQVNNARLTGPSFQDGLSLDWSGEYSYDHYLAYGTFQDVTSAVQPGEYAFEGTGTAGLGIFSEPTDIPAYVQLTDRLITNYNEIKSFDPSQPLTITWEPFTEGQGNLSDGVTPRGLIEVWIDYWDEVSGSTYVWSHLELPELLNEFDALPASTTSITIPANALTGSPDGYTIDIYFMHIDSYEDSQNLTGASVVHLRSMDTVMEIFPNQAEVDPWSNYTQFDNGWIDTGAWLGMLNISHAPWVYSVNESDYVYIPNNGVSSNGGWMYVPAPVNP